MRGMTTPQRLTPFTVTRGAEELYRIKTTLKAAGWVVAASGDGLSAYSSSGDIITSEGSGAGGMDNARAWYRIRMPAAVNGLRKELTLQMVLVSTPGSSTARIKYSPNAGFTTGGSANTTPSASDESLRMGSGTDASPGGSSCFSTNTSYFTGIADGSAPYGFVFWNIDPSGVDNDNASGLRFMLDPVRAPHHTDVEDPDKYVLHVSYGGSGNDPWDLGTGAISGQTAVTNSGSPGYTRYANGTFGYVALLQMRPSQTTGAPYVPDTGGSAPPQYDQWITGAATAVLVPAVYVCANSGVKGTSTLVHWVVGPQIGSANNHHFSVDGEARSHVRRQSLALPWGGPAIGDFVTLNATIIDINSADPPADPVDEAAPTITVVSPIGSVRKDSIIVLDFDDETGLAAVGIVAVVRDAQGRVLTEDPVYLVDGFRHHYRSAVNTIEATATGYRLSIRRDGGWLGHPTFEYVAVDGGGNIGVLA